MELSYILCVFVLSVIFTSDFSILSCVAATSCPVRAVPVSAPEVEGGFKCVCERNYYGKNCRFKARKQSIDADAKWVAATTAKITWHGQYGEGFHLSFRKVSYINGTVKPSKWFPATPSVNVEFSSTTLTWPALKPGTPANFSAEFRLPQANWEVYLSKVTSTGNVNASVSIFLDTLNSLALDERNYSKNHNNKTSKCAWFECPGQFFHVTNVMEDFGKPCFVHGIIFAIPVTIFGALLIGTFIYAVLRQCKRIKKRPTNKPWDGAELGYDENDVQNEKDNETVKSVIIEMPELDINSEQAKEETKAPAVQTPSKTQLESIAVTLEDVHKAIKPPSVHWTDEESLSESSVPSSTAV